MIKILLSDIFNMDENEDFFLTLRSSVRGGKLLFIPSSPEERDVTEFHGLKICNFLEGKNVSFSGVEYLYPDADFTRIKTEINEYSIIIMMGGIPDVQNEFIIDINLDNILLNYTGLILGISAGALNMCETVLDTPIDYENECTKILSGIGLTKMVVEVHFDKNNQNQLKALDETSLCIVCISDNGAIYIDYSETKLFGEIYLYYDSQVKKYI